MSKAVMRSAKPYWIYLILTGKKTVEVGKDYPKSKDWNRVVEMYCSKDKKSFNRIPEKDREWMRKYLGKVACRFICNSIEKYDYFIETPLDKLKEGEYRHYLTCNELERTCLRSKELEDYLDEKDGYGLHISDLVIYDRPKELGEFWHECDGNCLTKYKTCLKVKDHRVDIWSNCDRLLPLTRPPQSWCYVEAMEL